ncbi:hypothetical protein PENVUL_c016G07051 [Penicillium vulpinum]|uniref:Yeast cell wall synthesis Kre9/Knh1-like N-terminal domain-containing protein n=1 Tax=Penicillium vulpinum TaxID=29845 RepID=A0A1V6RYJ8_9EURO|nr:hypothetical protein PENVUL_c016G07051 [Penicillium vulpinum]
MRLSLILSLLPLALSVGAINVTEPTKNDKLDVSGSFTIKWTHVNTDASSVDIVLVNNDIYPPVSKKIASGIDTSDGSYSASGVKDVAEGSGFQINLLSTEAQNTGILAQSQKFEVTEAENSSSTASTTGTTTGTSSTVSSVSSTASTSASTSTGATTTETEASTTGTSTQRVSIIKPPGNSTSGSLPTGSHTSLTTASQSTSTGTSTGTKTNSGMTTSATGSATGSASASPTASEGAAMALVAPGAVAGLLAGLLALL